MARPATALYWTARRCFATDVGGKKRRILVKGRKTKANRELALKRLAVLLEHDTDESRPNTNPECDFNAKHVDTLAELIDLFIADCKMRIAGGEMKPNTLKLYYGPYARLIRDALEEIRLRELQRTTVLTYRSELIERNLRLNTIRNH